MRVLLPNRTLPSAAGRRSFRSTSDSSGSSTSGRVIIATILFREADAPA